MSFVTFHLENKEVFLEEGGVILWIIIIIFFFGRGWLLVFDIINYGVCQERLFE